MIPDQTKLRREKKNCGILKKANFRHIRSYSSTKFWRLSLNPRLLSIYLSLCVLNSQAPDVPELAHLGIFHFSRLSVNCFVKTVKKYSLNLNRTDFLKVLSVPQDHCGTQNNFTKIFSKNYTLYGVYIFPNFGFRLTRLAFNDTKTLFYI